MNTPFVPSRRVLSSAGFLLLSAIGLVALAAAEGEPTSEQLAFFEKKVRPVLVKHCYECHSIDRGKDKGGLTLDTREGIRRGGDSGHAVVPGNLKQSLLVEAVRHEDLEMPPKYRLPDDVIADLEKWIRMGAPDPRKAEKADLILREIDFDKAREFWAFKQPERRKAPTTKNRAWPRTDIDRHVLATLEAKGLHPVADAEKAALLRRAWYDLTGLPPSPEELDAFLKDASPKAFEKTVDRLLDSPAFGERWGRHWLDVVRYAESSGKERNFAYPAAWRYRDYVIDAFNRDLPYDRFIREQIAGDLLPAADQAESDRLLIATGALAFGPKSHNENSAAKFKMDLIDDQIDVTTRAFLGLTVSCARCHDHKFDPVPTRDYYSLAGVFESSRTYYGTKKTNGNRRPSTLLPIGELPDRPDALSPKEEAQLKRLTRQYSELKNRLAKQGKGKKKKGKKQKESKAQEARLSALRKQIEPLRARDSRPTEFAMGVRDSDRPGDCAIRIRGEEDKRGETVPRGFLTVLARDAAPRIPDEQSGRLQLADWIASPENPLTARVMANRIWQHLFGRGLVRTVDNFGTTGEPPSHPELLDFLALRLIDNQWSVKRTIREIMLSRTYQLGVAPDAANSAEDPDNFLVWRMNPKRLEAEAIRDGMLAASGELDRAPGVASLMADKEGDIGRKLRVSVSENDTRKRSVYLPVVRDELPEMFKVFDFAEPSLVVGRRDPTTVPTQALFLMNSRFAQSRSGALAKLLIENHDDDDQRVQTAYARVLNRRPTAEESRRDERYIAETRAAMNAGNQDAAEQAAWSAYCQALFASAEFRSLN